ncbi:FAD-binding protein [Streptomyces sp. NPDC056323]|uniref:FAD-binding protein n=1 Tax=Streptomyces sp. NPDC056323 TaxID=3345784 RepID=UPI0035D9107C
MGAPSVVPPEAAAPFFLVAERGIQGLIIVDGRGDRFVDEAAPYGRLVAGVERFNGVARAGHDEDFGRGTSAYDNYYGDPTLPHPNLAELATAPYYAVPVHPGDLGTKGGLLTDADARVLRADGSPIAGLYAAGNVAAAVMGETYPGPGATIGPAMAFGWIAVEHLAASGPTA